ncbi:hypothetical protein TNCV_4384631 [Trichonephila clavipes]|nr:hypothetical protein TNCV_4384631 [Trichonephila clavipes]
MVKLFRYGRPLALYSFEQGTLMRRGNNIRNNSSESYIKVLLQSNTIGRGSQVVKVADSWPACHEFEPEPLKTRRIVELMRVKSVGAQTSSRWCGAKVWRGREGVGSGVILVTLPWIEIPSDVKVLRESIARAQVPLCQLIEVRGSVMVADVSCVRAQCHDLVEWLLHVESVETQIVSLESCGSSEREIPAQVSSVLFT